LWKGEVVSGKRKHAKAMKNKENLRNKKKKMIISDGVLKRKIVIESKLAKGMLTQYPNLGQRYKRKIIFTWKENWRLQ